MALDQKIRTTEVVIEGTALRIDERFQDQQTEILKRVARGDRSVTYYTCPSCGITGANRPSKDIASCDECQLHYVVPTYTT